MELDLHGKLAVSKHDCGLKESINWSCKGVSFSSVKNKTRRVPTRLNNKQWRWRCWRGKENVDVERGKSAALLGPFLKIKKRQ